MNAVGFGTEWRASRAILKHTFYSRWNQGGNWLNWILLGAAVLVPLAALALKGRPSLVVSIGFGAPAGVLVFLWWFMLISSVVQQNQGHARLVPRMAQRSVMVLLFAWVTATLGLTLLYAIGGTPVAMKAAIIGLGLIVPALMLLRPVHCVVGFILIYNLPDLGLKYVLTDATLLPTMGVAILVLGALVLHAVYRGCGLTQRTFNAPVATLLPKGGVSRLYAWQLRRDCERRLSGRLLMHCNGQSMKLSTLAIVAGGGAALLLMAYFWTAKAKHLHIVLTIFVPVLVVSFQIIGAYAIMAGVYAARREHAVVRLAPGVPGARDINRFLARGVLIEFANLWLVTTAIVLLASWQRGAEAGRLMQLLAACCLTLPCAGMLLRDYSSSNHVQAWVRTVRMLLLAGAFLSMLAAAFGEVNLQAWGRVAALFIAFSACFGWWRWNAMLHAPTALPPGRRD